MITTALFNRCRGVDQKGAGMDELIHTGCDSFKIELEFILNNIDYIKVRLTYISQKDDSRLIKEFAYTKDELESYVINLLKDYLSFYKIILEHDNLKVQTANTLKFPYESYRKGQRELSKYVYGTIKNEDTLFIEAPTGIGKTMSTLFPAVKTFGTENTEKIF